MTPVAEGPRRAPLAHLAAFYLLVFAALGAFVPYWTLYLQSIGFGAERIGTLLAMMAAVRVVAPPAWGWLADRRGSSMSVVRGCTVAAALVFALVLVHQSYWWLVSVLVVYQLFWSGVLPQFEAVTLAHLGPAAATYPRVRLWGSVGFIVTTLAVGVLLERQSVVEAPAVVWVVLLACAAFAMTVPAPARARVRSRPRALRLVLLRADVVVFLASAALMQVSHAPYYVLYSIHLDALGHAEGVIGFLWAFGVLAEIALFAAMPRLLGGTRLATLLLACFVFTAVRWAMIGSLSASLVALLAAQALHAVSFGLHHAVSVQIVHRLFPGELAGRGQAIYAGFGYGAGGVLGNFAAGYAWVALGARGTWFAAMAVSALGGLLALWLSRRWARDPRLAVERR